MNYGKYIIVGSSISMAELPIMFSPMFSHSEIARDREVISAGFFEVHYDKGEIQVGAFGESITVEKKSRKEDSEILKKVMVYNDEFYPFSSKK